MKKPILKWYVDGGEADVCFPADWEANDPLFRMDVLKDWILDMQTAYERACDQFREQGNGNS